MTKKAFPALFLCVVAVALALRTARLDLRPMHHDEANQAAKFGDLLERGEYRYDPEEHHGPSLYYLTYPVVTAAGVATYAKLDEALLRLVPAIFGTGILLLLLLFKGALSHESLLFSGLFLALSPVMGFYSRFYIQETLLVFFLAGLIAAGWRFVREGSLAAAAAAGLSAGLMFATKETSLVLFGSIAAALALGGIAGLSNRGRDPEEGVRARPRIGPGKIILSCVVFAAFAFASAGLLFTSFFRHPSGLRDSVLAFGTYFERAGGAGVHSHPWATYLKTLAWSRFGNGPVWSEAFLLALALVGGVAALVPGRKENGRTGSLGFRRFVLFFTVTAAAAYSFIPYKTPWNMLPFVFGLAILAGSGSAVLLRAGRSPVAKLSIAALLVLGFASLGYQSYRANFEDYAEPSNPYVYAQTSRDYLRLVEAVESVSDVSPEGRDLLIKVIAPPDETWPLPWSLRQFTRVGYWTDVDAAGDPGEASVIVSSAAFAGEIETRLGDGFLSAFYSLRPEVLLALHVRRDLWDRLLDVRR
jgi:uncharacterized protein (TIGR03663 family)